MSFPRPVRMHNQISSAMVDVAKKALADLEKIPASKIAEKDGDIKSGRITMEKAAKLYPAMHSVGFDLFRIASDDETLPTIWKREVFTDKDTGTKVEWLVAYTTDDDDIMREVASSLKKVAAEPGAGAGPGAPPKKNQTPIAPGVLNKNLNLDQSGQGGTAKVTVEFNDLEKGQTFFESVEQNAGGAAKEPAAPGAPPEEAPKEEEEAPKEEEPKGPGGPPEPTPAGGPPGGPAAGPPPAPMASTIKTLTTYGQQMVTVKAEKFAKYPTEYYYINEVGERVDLPFKPVLGSKFNRPDQPGTMIRVMHIETEAAKSDDDAILKALGVDISDQVPPMNWTNKESQNEDGEGGKGAPLPPQPALQQGQPPTADTTQKPLYDSTQDSGTKPKYNISVNPEDGSVTVKLDKSPAVDAIEQAVNGPQSPMPPAQPPAQQPPPGTQAGAPMAGQPKQNFNETESPVQF